MVSHQLLPAPPQIRIIMVHETCDDYTQHQATTEHIYDVVVIGAGPCGLAVAARLREKYPSALFTDSEQSRYHWIARNAHRATIKTKSNGRLREPNRGDLGLEALSMLVLDSSGDEWMTQWHALFKKLQISHLRSPLFFHPDPSDRDALLAYLHASGGHDKMQEIGGCIGKEISKHKKKKRQSHRAKGPTPAISIDERDRKDYFAPSTSCFHDFCDTCVRRYGLNDNIIKHGTVTDITYGVSRTDYGHDSLFTLHTTAGQYLARTVVLAVGPGTPSIPAPFPKQGSPGASHVMTSPSHSLLPAVLRSRIAAGVTTNVLVIGGGLTSAQVIDNAIRSGVNHAWLLIRGPQKVKPFDVDLSWMSKFRNHERAVFWSAESDNERLFMIAKARNGGSITPRYARRLDQLVGQDRVNIHSHTVVATQSYDSGTGYHTVATDPPIPNMPRFDHIFFATGTSSDIKDLDFLKTLHQRHPLTSSCGLPRLTDNLQWSHDVPLFVTGKLAGLQLGPGAGNLEGARLGAERISWAIEHLLQQRKEADVGDTFEYSDYVAGVGSKFSDLGLDDPA